jgi:hypothetical protein
VRQVFDHDKGSIEYALRMLRSLPINVQVRAAIKVLVEVLANMEMLCKELPYLEPQLKPHVEGTK